MLVPTRRAGASCQDPYSAPPLQCVRYSDIATVVFSHPPIGVIGLTEPDARAEFGDSNVVVKEAKFPSMMCVLW